LERKQKRNSGKAYYVENGKTQDEKVLQPLKENCSRICKDKIARGRQKDGF
jgi:hypothetical protein